jgi:tRNA-dihydrouridine synthase A
MRLITRHTRLYTEMLPTHSLTHQSDDALAFNDIEHPIAIQLAGESPSQLAECAKRAQYYHYDEINLNLGCPSNRAQKGKFGACMMQHPEKIADGLRAIREKTSLPVTAKIRLGLDETAKATDLNDFVSILKTAGCQSVIVHARYVNLSKSPQSNRKPKTLHYERVYDLKQTFPDLTIVLNGGINSISDIEKHLAYVDGVMIGQAAYQNPYLFAEIDHRFFGDPHPILTREAIFEHYKTYMIEQHQKNANPSLLIRPLFGLYHGCSGARQWRQKTAKLLQGI